MPLSHRLKFVSAGMPHQPEPFAQVVRHGLALAQKSLPCRYFYDNVGSELFERICQLEEYYPTRTERGILEQYAPEIAAAVGANVALVEFGSGSSCKTRLLIESLLARQPALHYVPIDISAEFLHASAVTLLTDYDRLAITAIGGEYNDGIAAVPDHDGANLLLFLGSNIGNFEAADAVDFLVRVRQRMKSCDRFLLGVDMVKPRPVLEAAYNDASGVTAAFNKNLLHRINRELGATFAPEAFDHAAPFVDAHSRIEMRLVSRERQTVRLPDTGEEFSFAAGEFIHTENSHKYTPASFGALCRAAGLEVEAQWSDPREWFAVILLKTGTKRQST